MRNLDFTSDSPQSIKLGDSSDTLSLRVTEFGQPVDLSKASSIAVKIGNESGFLTEIDVNVSSLLQPTSGIINVVIDSKISSNLPAGQYLLEVWVYDTKGNIAIYPDTSYPNVIGFSIEKNIMGSTLTTEITTLTLASFESQFDDMKKDFQEKVTGSYFKGQKGDPGPKGDPGDKGDRGNQIFKSNKDYDPYTPGHWWSDLSPVPSVDNPPKIGDTVITPSGNIFQIENVVVGGVGGGGTFMGGDSLGNIKGPQGDKGDKGDTGTVDNAGLTTAPAFVNLQTQVNNSAVGTNLIVQSDLKAGYINRDDGSATADANDFYSDNYIPTNGKSVFTLSSQDYVFMGNGDHVLAMYDSNKKFLGWQSITSATQILSKSNAAYIRFSINFVDEGGTSGNSSDWLNNHRYKLEKGNVATDWCPNPTEILTQSDYAKIQAAIIALGGSLK